MKGAPQLGSDERQEYQHLDIHKRQILRRRFRVARVEVQNFVGDGVALEWNERVKLLERRNVNHFPPELRADERPRHPDQRFQPERWMDDVTTLQRLSKATIEQLVALLEPREWRRVLAIWGTVQINQNVILRHQLLQGFHDVVKQIVHHIIVIFPRTVGQVARAEDNYRVVSAGFEITAVR